jgi:hypothetical protein
VGLGAVEECTPTILGTFGFHLTTHNKRLQSILLSMSNNQVEKNIQEWFEQHGLPWSDEIAKKLSDYGVECVEHLKLPEPEFIADLFKGEKPIVKTMVKLAWKHPAAAR